ncbi:MAG TPA: hypothetical protein VMW25_05685 [Clostridia bacterium]|nr:hypothetical protein [Clostridia bacterium]
MKLAEQDRRRIKEEEAAAEEKAETYFQLLRKAKKFDEQFGLCQRLGVGKDDKELLRLLLAERLGRARVYDLVWGLKRKDLILNFATEESLEANERALLRLRSHIEPLSYIMGEKAGVLSLAVNYFSALLNDAKDRTGQFKLDKKTLEKWGRQWQARLKETQTESNRKPYSNVWEGI